MGTVTLARSVDAEPPAVEPAERAQDRETARRLWEVSEELTGVAFDLPAG